MDKEHTNDNNVQETATPVVSEDISTPTPTNETKASVTQENKTSNTLIVIIGILVFMAGIQVFQTQKLYAAVSTGSVTTAPQATQQSGTALPSQVGGCG